MGKQNIMIVSGIGLIVAIAALVFFTWQSLANTIVLNVPFESNGFRMVYPKGWQHQILQTNILFLSSPETLQLEAGASMVVQRSIRLTGETETLEEALKLYLERGPLRTDGAWEILAEIAPITFAQRDAIAVALEGADSEDAIPMHSKIIATRADNGLIYIFAVSAPVERWNTDGETLELILASVEILE
jgi:hypothetical protein